MRACDGLWRSQTSFVKKRRNPNLNPFQSTNSSLFILLLFFILCGGDDFDTTQLLLALALFSSLDLTTNACTTQTTCSLT